MDGYMQDSVYGRNPVLLAIWNELVPQKPSAVGYEPLYAVFYNFYTAGYLLQSVSN